MIEWCSSEQIGQMFAVGANRLRGYAFRGNLGCRQLPDGTLLYDSAQVARLFAPRGAALKLPEVAGEGTHLGQLGAVRLGVASNEEDETVRSGAQSDEATESKPSQDGHRRRPRTRRTARDASQAPMATRTPRHAG